MGKLELEARSLRRRGYLQNAVLATLGIAGVLAVATVAPNVIQVLGLLAGGQKRFGEQARSAAGRLVAKGHAKFVTVDGKRSLEITEAGRRELARVEMVSQLRAGSIKPKRWDKRWRLVVFDIPEPRKKSRDHLRYMVASYGFLRIQDSVWVYPYDCEEVIALLKTDMKLKTNVLYAIVERIENDGWIRKHFGLRASL